MNDDEKLAFGTFARFLNDALQAMTAAIEIAADKTAADAVEFIADYLNGCDAVAEDGPANYQKWLNRGRP